MRVIVRKPLRRRHNNIERFLMINKKISVLFCLLFLAALQLAATNQPERLSGNAAWSEDFNRSQKNGLPEKWKEEGTKIGVPATVCRVKNSENISRLEIVCDKSTGGIIIPMRNIDLKKTPVMRWRWRVLNYPAGADGRNPEKDDQPIGIYVGTNAGLFKKKSIAYRWETLTPKGFEGSATYAGILSVHYIVMQNDQVPAGTWITEERNIAEDFKRIYGSVPDKFALSVIGNSQYTSSNTIAELDFIEFIPGKK